jgi:hypothetical protein
MPKVVCIPELSARLTHSLPLALTLNDDFGITEFVRHVE